ncbi:MAG: hypothetical protein HY900_16015 [Deltaproteobacteria bacterium]|nr:hypothetical protein [Deltaproteobacteria bacterium]
MRHPIEWISGAVLLLCAATGCGGSKPYARADLPQIPPAKIAVLPFDNLSEAKGAGKTMENILLVELLKHSPFRALDPGEVAEALSQERIRLATAIPKENLRNLGQKLGVPLVVVGIVYEYGLDTAGSGGAAKLPIVAVTVRVLETATGEIVWASNVVRRGNDRETLFGVGREDSLLRLAEQTGREIAVAFAASVGRRRAAETPGGAPINAEKPTVR